MQVSACLVAMWGNHPKTLCDQLNQSKGKEGQSLEVESRDHMVHISKRNKQKNKQLTNGVANRHDYNVDCLCDIADIVVMRCMLVMY